MRHELGERFIQPQIVPPLHGDQVAKPHVCQFVQDGVGTGTELGASRGSAEQVLITEGNAACVLHCAGVVLGYEDLVILREWVRPVVHLLVETKALLGHVDDAIGVKVLF